jgi:UPF0716 family protein affecting phage T7 exclusion
VDLANWGLSKNVLFGLGFTLATCVISAAVALFIFVRMPANYFSDHASKPSSSKHPVIRWTMLILKNVLGAILIAAGIVMLVTPGQGVLTIVIGIMLLNFPEKRKLLRALLARPRIREAINTLRARFNKPPLILDAETKGDGNH